MRRHYSVIDEATIFFYMLCPFSLRLAVESRQSEKILIHWVASIPFMSGKNGSWTWTSGLYTILISNEIDMPLLRLAIYFQSYYFGNFQWYFITQQFLLGLFLVAPVLEVHHSPAVAMSAECLRMHPSGFHSHEACYT